MPGQWYVMPGAARDLLLVAVCGAGQRDKQIPRPKTGLGMTPWRHLGDARGTPGERPGHACKAPCGAVIPSAARDLLLVAAFNAGQRDKQIPRPKTGLGMTP